MKVELEKRPWGHYVVHTTMPGVQIKTLTIYPGHSTSLQSHKHRTERWTGLEGCGVAEIQIRTSEIKSNKMFIDEMEKYDPFLPGDVHIVDVEMKHRLSNPGTVPFVVLEIQTGPKIDEMDIIRYEDQYGRSTATDPASSLDTPFDDNQPRSYPGESLPPRE